MIPQSKVSLAQFCESHRHTRIPTKVEDDPCGGSREVFIVWGVEVI